MKLKITEYTSPSGVKHLIVYFVLSQVTNHVRTLKLYPDGSVGPGPQIQWEHLPNHKDSKCKEFEVEFSLFEAPTVTEAEEHSRLDALGVPTHGRCPATNARQSLSLEERRELLLKMDTCICGHRYKDHNDNAGGPMCQPGCSCGGEFTPQAKV